jgi:hypothetical protein
MEAVDGNAIGGLLHEVFGTEMTDAASVCGSCGTVARCRSCDSVLMVFVKIRDRPAWTCWASPPSASNGHSCGDPAATACSPFPPGR